jgi:hypothetical protein
MKTRLTLRLATQPVARSFGRVQRWLADHIIQNVPEEVSVCEYECQEPDCHIAKWAMCEKRATRPEKALFRID